MNRDDLVTIPVGGDYGKPRPALVVQADEFDAIPSVTVLRLTSDVPAGQGQATFDRLAAQPAHSPSAYCQVVARSPYTPWRRIRSS